MHAYKINIHWELNSIYKTSMTTVFVDCQLWLTLDDIIKKMYVQIVGAVFTILYYLANVQHPYVRIIFLLIVPNSNSILWFFRALLLKMKTKQLGYMHNGLLISPCVDLVNATLNLSLTDMTSTKPLTEPGLLLNFRLYL